MVDAVSIGKEGDTLLWYLWMCCGVGGVVESLGSSGSNTNNVGVKAQWCKMWGDVRSVMFHAEYWRIAGLVPALQCRLRWLEYTMCRGGRWRWLYLDDDFA